MRIITCLQQILDEENESLREIMTRGGAASALPQLAKVSLECTFIYISQRVIYVYICQVEVFTCTCTDMHSRPPQTLHLRCRMVLTNLLSRLCRKLCFRVVSQLIS